MKITISSIVLLLLFSLTSFAQNIYSIKGSVTDTAEKSLMRNTTVMVVSAKDSILQKFTRAAADGSFSINGLPPGAFRLFLSYPGYANYSDAFILGPDKKEVDFGKINMELKAKLLQDVIIKGEVTAIKIKGDTTEFNAKAYVIQPNAKVEDLLKQLPGIQVDKDGKITAQGQAVQKVLLDGEEFFGDDPTLVTKNIRADMVDKVQLYDKKSDQAAFTGIDDGVKIKTLNIKLKDDKKNGYFGKVDGGAGTDGYYDGEALYNKFKAKEKIAAYVTTANDGKTGLSWDDNQKYGDGGNVQVSDNGGIYISGGGNDLNYNGQGIPMARTGGVHFDNKWQSDKQSLNANYKMGLLDVDGTKNTLTQNNLPGSIINSNANQTFHNSTFREKTDGTYLITFDTTSTLKVAFDATYKHTKSNTSYLTTSYKGIDTLLNNSNRTVTNDATQHLYDISAFYTKKLKKKGRTLSVLFSESVNNSDNTGTLLSNTGFYGAGGVLDSTQNVNQYKTGSGRNHIFNSNITYTEPLSKFFSVILNYGLNINNNISDQKSFDQSPGGSYNLLDTSLSNHFTFDQLSNQGGAVFNYNKDKLLVNFGSHASDVTYSQIDGYSGDILKRHFINWNPQASFQYKFSQQQAVRLNYNGNTSQPSISQIQPLKNNSDPLFITLGNEGLKPSFTNNINGYYSNYKVLSGQDVYFNGNYSFTSDPIVNNTTTDPATGKTISQYFNLPGKTPYSYGGYGGISRKIPGIDLSVGLQGSIRCTISYNMVNSVLNTDNSSNYSGGITLSKYMENKYDFYVNLGPSYNVRESSLEKSDNSNSRGFNGYSYFNLYLPAKLQINSNLDYTFTGKSAAFNQDVYYTDWDITLSKAFFKASNLKFSVTAHDLLNQNVGFNRQVTGSQIVQNTYNTIRRYFMFSVSWDFTKMGGVPEKK